MASINIIHGFIHWYIMSSGALQSITEFFLHLWAVLCYLVALWIWIFFYIALNVLCTVQTINHSFIQYMVNTKSFVWSCSIQWPVSIKIISCIVIHRDISASKRRKIVLPPYNSYWKFQSPKSKITHGRRRNRKQTKQSLLLPMHKRRFVMFRAAFFTFIHHHTL